MKDLKILEKSKFKKILLRFKYTISYLCIMSVNKKQKEELTYKLVIIQNLISILAGLYLVSLIFESIFAKILLIFIYFVIIYYIYKKRISREKKHESYLSLSLITATLLFFLVSIKNSDILALSFSILFATAAYNYISQIFNTKGISYLNMLIIILTIITADATYPILRPKVEISNIGEFIFGEVIDNEEYARRDYTVEVTPPMLKINPCKTILLGEKIKKIEYVKDIYGLNVTYNSDGRTNFCINSDFKSITVLRISSNRDINYLVGPINLTRFYWISSEDKSIRQHSISFNNYDSFPIFFTGNITFRITKDTEFDSNEYMWNELMNETGKIQCKLNQFFFNQNLTNLDMTTIYDKKITKDSIFLKFKVNIRLEPYTYNTFHILYYPNRC